VIFAVPQFQRKVPQRLGSLRNEPVQSKKAYLSR
jgi:hypothetical protein